jgi:ABC-2 type transport system ATP-binding protein
MSAAISVRGLTVERGGRVVLPGVDLDVEAGTVTGLLGPSGGGKSTLMRAIVGVQIVQSGTVEVLGLAAGSPALRSRVGYMTQQLSVYRDLTVRENLHYFARLLRTADERIGDVLAMVDLEDVAGRIVDRLSGGQQARVSLATALLGAPDVLVLDEPTVGLDPLLRRDLWTLFHSLAGGGATLLVSSHVMDEAAHCDQLVLLRDGHVLAEAPPQRLLADTGTTDLEDAFVALIAREAA